MWWRRVLDSGSFAKVFAMELSEIVSACPHVRWVLKVSKAPVFKSSLSGRALKDVCVAHVFAGMPDVAPPVLRVFDMRIQQGHAFVLMHRADWDLFVWAKAHKYSLTHPETLAAKLILSHQLFEGIHRMHTLGEGLVHCDIKPDNVMVHGLQAFLIDFEFARRVNDTRPWLAGTRDFMSPEYLHSQVCGRETDIWAAGVTLFLLFLNRYPYQPYTSDRAAFLHHSKSFAATMAKNGAQRDELRKVFALLFAQCCNVDLGATLFGMFRSLFNEDAAVRVEAFSGVLADAARLAKAAAGYLKVPWPVPAAGGAEGATAQCAEAVQQLAEGPLHPVFNTTAGIGGVQRCLEWDKKA
mmetsp:Transcript_87520/g.267776  ORF Transcript_87520/g.267776 Transcript_87520/m.267776 type:complete len:353 (-) Transcript_87520:161-1219(-)